MALTDNTTFYGKDAEGFYKQILTSANAKNELTLLPGVKSKIKLASYDLGNILQADTCTPSATGEGTLAQKTIEVCDLMIHLSFCALTFEQNYLSMQLKAGSNSDQVMPDSFERFMLASVAEKVASDIEKVVFHGDTGTTSYPYSLCDGLIDKMLGDSDVIDVSATASLSSTNIVTELDRILSAVPAKVRSKADFVIFISQEMAFYYKQKQASTTGGLFLVGDKELNYLGFKLVATDALSEKQAIAGARSNMFFATDLVSDFEEVRVIPQANISGARTAIISGAFKFGVDYMFGEEIVLYSGGTVMS